MAIALLALSASILPMLVLVTNVKAAGDPLLGDVDGNGVVDTRDLAAAAKAYGSYGPDGPYHQSPGIPATPNWDPRADFNGNNQIDILDLLIIVKNFGATA